MLYGSEVSAAQSADGGSRVSGPPLKSLRSWLVTVARLDEDSSTPPPPPPLKPPKEVLTTDQLVVATTLLSSGDTLPSVCRSARVPVACVCRGPAVAASTQPPASSPRVTLAAAPMPVSRPSTLMLPPPRAGRRPGRGGGWPPARRSPPARSPPR